MSTDPLVHEGEVRTVMDCHNCHQQFVALLDYSINGNHYCECPNCGHTHYRVITNGKITDDRWDSKNYDSSKDDKDKHGVKARRVWKHNILRASTSSASEFLKQRWLEKLQ